VIVLAIRQLHSDQNGRLAFDALITIQFLCQWLRLLSKVAIIPSLLYAPVKVHRRGLVHFSFSANRGRLNRDCAGRKLESDPWPPVGGCFQHLSTQRMHPITQLELRLPKQLVTVC
jgi:hypothetical protein